MIHFCIIFPVNKLFAEVFDCFKEIFLQDLTLKTGFRITHETSDYVLQKSVISPLLETQWPTKWLLLKTYSLQRVWDGLELLTKTYSFLACPVHQIRKRPFKLTFTNGSHFATQKYLVSICLHLVLVARHNLVIINSMSRFGYQFLQLLWGQYAHW